MVAQETISSVLTTLALVPLVILDTSVVPKSKVVRNDTVFAVVSASSATSFKTVGNAGNDSVAFSASNEATRFRRWRCWQ